MNLERVRWDDKAACAGQDTSPWFARSNHSHYSRAMRTCQACQVRAQCLTFALTYGEEYGIWGGTSADQRTALDARLRNGEPLSHLVTETLGHPTPGKRRGTSGRSSAA